MSYEFELYVWNNLFKNVLKAQDSKLIAGLYCLHPRKRYTYEEFPAFYGRSHSSN